MKVKVEYYATLRELLKIKWEEVEVKEGASVSDLMEVLVSLHGETLAQALNESRKLVNGRDVEGLGGLKIILKEGDVLSLFPPIGGG